MTRSYILAAPAIALMFVQPAVALTAIPTVPTFWPQDHAFEVEAATRNLLSTDGEPQDTPVRPEHHAR